MILWYKDTDGKYRVLNIPPTGYWLKGRVAVPDWEPYPESYMEAWKMPEAVFKKVFEHSLLSSAWVLREDI